MYVSIVIRRVKFVAMAEVDVKSVRGETMFVYSRRANEEEALLFMQMRDLP